MDGRSTKKFTWVLENFSKLTAKMYSDPFITGCCKWRLLVFPKGNKVDHLSVYLDVVNAASLPSQWKRHARLILSVVNQFSEKQTLSKGSEHWFNARENDWGFTEFMPLFVLNDRNKGYLVNNTVIVQAEVDVLEVHGKVDILGKPAVESRTGTAEGGRAEGSLLAGSQGDIDSSKGNSTLCSSPVLVDAEKAEIFGEVASLESSQEPVKASETIENDQVKSDDATSSSDASKISPIETKLKVQTVDVNGFLVLDTEAESVNQIFEKHPDLALNFRPRNQQLKTAYVNVLLSLVEILCRSPQDISDDDLSNARNTLIDLQDAGLKLDWLKTKFEEVSKRKERAGGAQLDELKQQFEKLKLMMSDFEAELEKEKEEVAAVRVPLSFCLYCFLIMFVMLQVIEYLD